MKKAYVILNPVAGSSEPEALQQRIEQRFSEAGQAYELHETTGEERLAEVVAQALDRGFDLLVAAGGDGTVSGVVDGLAHTGVPLGIVPVGTGNALARDLGVPLDVKDALALLLGENAVKPIDALQVGDRFFVLNIGVGVSAQILRETNSQEKRRLGRVAYLWNAMTNFLGLKTYRFSLTVDGLEHRPRATELHVLNSGAIGSPFLGWGADIHVDDGQAGVYAFRPHAVLDYVSIGWNLLRGQRQSDPSIRYWRARQSIVIRASQPLAVQGDGDVIGETPVEVKVVPDAIQMVTPPTRETR